MIERSRRAAALTCTNGHAINASWAVPVERPKPGERIAPVHAVQTRCPTCGNRLDVFVDDRADLGTFKIRSR